MTGRSKGRTDGVPDVAPVSPEEFALEVNPPRVPGSHKPGGVSLIRKLTTLFVALAASLAVGVTPAQADLPPLMLGPGDAGVHDMGSAALIRYSKYGPVYI